MAADTIGFKARYANGYGYLSNFYPNVADLEKPARTTAKPHGRPARPARVPQPAHRDYLFVDEEGRTWRSTEHYYQWHRYAPHSRALGDAIRAAPTALAAKQLTSQSGYAAWRRRAHPEDRRSLVALRAELKRWKAADTAIDLMRRALRLKFEQNPELRAALEATAPHRLSEYGRSPRDFWAHTGQDMLGRLLMELRAELAAEDRKPNRHAD